MFTEKAIQNFNELEINLYNYIMRNKEKIPYMTIRELAKEAHVSTTTITRFCQKLSCNGYTEFKIHFKMFVNEMRTDPIKDDKSVFFEFLKRASSDDFIKNLDEISHVLRQASNIIFVGTGNSGVMARYAARYFSSIGKFSLYLDDYFYPVSQKDSKGSVFIILSVEGESAFWINAITSLKMSGSTIITITNSSQNTIARLADHNISYYVQRELRTNQNSILNKLDVTTQLPVVYIIETLAKKTGSLL